jgi:hypothetical protein
MWKDREMEITIQTDLDLTPTGKRSARYVQSRNGLSLRWYVAGRIYRKGASLAHTHEWLANAGKPNHCPQPWAAFE